MQVTKRYGVVDSGAHISSIKFSIVKDMGLVEKMTRTIEEVTPWGPPNAVKVKTLGQLRLKVLCGRVAHEHVFRVVDQQDDVILGLDIHPAIGISVANSD